jgi:hypothetical protein
MAQHTSSALFDNFRKSLQCQLLDIAYDVTHKNPPSQDRILSMGSHASRTLLELKRTGEMMALDASTHELTRVAPISYFHQVLERDGQWPMTEFEWGCLYTHDSLNMLTEHITGNRNSDDIARNFQAQAILWDMRVRFPSILSGAGDRALPSYDVRQIPSAAVVSTRSRIPQLVRAARPEETYFTYNPQRPPPTRDNQLRARSESEDACIVGLYRNPSIEPR